MSDKHSISVTFSFSSPELEFKLKNYLSRQSKTEIFVACLGSISGEGKNGIYYEICQFLPFPNLSQTPQITVIPPENWEQILEETLKLEGLRFLGFIHSHPGEISQRSKADTSYSLFLSSKHGSILMGIIGKGMSLRMYQVTENRFILINGTSKYFRIKTK